MPRKKKPEFHFPPEIMEIFGRSAYLTLDGTYYQLLVNEEDAATARKVLETLPEARP